MTNRERMFFWPDKFNTTKVEPGVYNGRRKIHAEDWMFMDSERIKECVKSLKIKNTEGYDRIPQRIIIDGLDCLDKPLTKLFELVYREKKVPGQWLISKINDLNNIQWLWLTKP